MATKKARRTLKSAVKVGDVVQLKSGGQLMTVDAEYSDGVMQVRWFEGGSVCNATVHRSALEKA